MLDPSSRRSGVNLDGKGSLASHLSAGESHTCAVLRDGAVRCWGDGSEA